MLCKGFTSAATFVPTGITETVWASRRRRPRKWTTTSVWSVNGARRAAQRSCTASVKHHMMSLSKELQECVCVCVCASYCFCGNMFICFEVCNKYIKTNYMTEQSAKVVIQPKYSDLVIKGDVFGKKFTRLHRETEAEPQSDCNHRNEQR